MKSVTLQELGTCSEEELGLPEPVISKLLNQGLLKKEDGYTCLFVGVAVVSGWTLKCYPKFLPDCEGLPEVLRVLEKLQAEGIAPEIWTEGPGASDYLSAVLFLLSDYFENGVYRKTEERAETNGTGEILWDRTINSCSMLLDDGYPYYPEIITRKRADAEHDYFMRLHECLLTKASKEMEEADILSLFGFPAVSLSEEEISAFGDGEYALYMIDRELGTEFSTHRQLVLKAMRALLSEEGWLSDSDFLAVYGTTCFYRVWETVCQEVLANQLSVPLALLNLPLPLSAEYDRNSTLLGIIEKPFWSFTGKAAGDTLIPDIVALEGTSFLIFDAKYYTPMLEPGQPPEDQPGIESVAKQYLYQLAYKDFIVRHGFTTVRNCFLLPTAEDSVIDKGEVRMEMLCSLGLEPVQVRLLPASIAFGCYLRGEKLDISLLRLMS